MENENTTRRGFLRLLGLGSAMGAGLAVTGTGSVMAAPATAPAQAAFNFTCDCGAAVVAAVPPQKGMVVNTVCANGHRYQLTWKGTHFACRRAS